MVDYGEFWNRSLIDSQVSNARRIRTPPVSTEIPAAVDLFLINPIQTSVQNFCVAVTRQSTLATLHAQILNIQIAVANETNHSSVWTESFTDFFFRITSQTNGTIASEFVIEKIVGPVNEHCRLCWIQLI